jgi:hypothetical protein
LTTGEVAEANRDVDLGLMRSTRKAAGLDDPHEE